MGLMDRMIGNMSVQEKEEMMLKMMPLMMKDVDMLKMMPGMMSCIERHLNVTGIVTFVRRILKDDELKGQLEKLVVQLPQLSRKIQSMMANMRLKKPGGIILAFLLYPKFKRMLV